METGFEKVNINTEDVKSYKGLFVSLLIFLIAGLAGFFLAKPMYARNQENEAQIESKEVELERLDQKIAELERVQDFSGNIEENKIVAVQAVPSEDEVPIVMTMVQKIAADSGVVLNSLNYAGNTTVSFGESSDTAPTAAGANAELANNAFRMNISIIGQFSSVKLFLENLENSRRLINVSSFGYSLASQQTTEEEFIDGVTTNLLLTSFYKDFSEAAGVIDLDRNTNVLNKIKSMENTEVDLDEVNLGKDDPFSSEDSDAPLELFNEGSEDAASDVSEESGTEGVGTIEDTEINSVEPENSEEGQAESSESEDMESEEEDLNEVLQQIIEEEQGSQE